MNRHRSRLNEWKTTDGRAISVLKSWKKINIFALLNSKIFWGGGQCPLIPILGRGYGAPPQTPLSTPALRASVSIVPLSVCSWDFELLPTWGIHTQAVTPGMSPTVIWARDTCLATTKSTRYSSGCCAIITCVHCIDIWRLRYSLVRNTITQFKSTKPQRQAFLLSRSSAELSANVFIFFQNKIRRETMCFPR